MCVAPEMGHKNAPAALEHPGAGHQEWSLMPKQEYRCGRCGERGPAGLFPPSKARYPGQWCRPCLRWSTHLRAYADGRVSSPLPVKYRTRCEVCGELFTTGKCGLRFCSRKCKNHAKNSLLKAERVLAKASAPTRLCPHCGEALAVSKRADAAFCSARCEQAAHNATRKAKIKTGSKPEYVSRASIIERDGGICHICGEPVDSDALHLDHVIPLARGGSHTPENLRVAHAACNMSKGARLISAA